MAAYTTDPSGRVTELMKKTQALMAVAAMAMIVASSSCGDGSESGSDGNGSTISLDKIVVTSDLSGDLDIWIVNPDGTEIMNLTNNPPTINDPLGVDADPAWSPDSKKIAFMSTRTGEGEIWVMNADGSNPLNLTNDPTRWDHNPEWSPAGDKIVYISTEISPATGSPVEDTAEIFVIEVDGSNRTQLTNNDYSEAYPVFSPNGKMIVFHSDKGKVIIGECEIPPKGLTFKYANEIYVMESNGDNVVQLTNTGDRGNKEVSWSPNGTKLVYSSNQGCDPGDIYVMNVGNLQDMDLETLQSLMVEDLQEMEELEYLSITKLTSDAGPDTHPSFSPDGTEIVFQSVRGGDKGEGNDLFIMDADGQNVFRVMRTSALEKDPDWMR